MLQKYSVSHNTKIEFVQYDQNTIQSKTLSETDDVKSLFDNAQKNWVNIVGLSNTTYITSICTSLGLYNFDINELLFRPDVIKIVAYDNIYFALLSIFTKNGDNAIIPQQVAFILGENYLVSILENNESFLGLLDTYVENNMVTLKRKSSDFLFYLLISAVCMHNNQFVLKEEEHIVAIEEKLLEDNNGDDILHFLHTQRLAQMKMKHFNNSLREEFENIFDNDNELIQDDTLNYFNNLEDRIRSLSANIEYYRESIFSLQDLYYNTINTNTNNVMKRLTVISIIFIPLTFLAGIWGMNFKFMPELDFKYGYLYAWTSFLIVAILIIFYMRRKKWF